jgi:hypothetical protein
MSLVERQLGACDLHGDRQRDTVQDVVFADGQLLDAGPAAQLARLKTSGAVHKSLIVKL